MPASARTLKESWVDGRINSRIANSIIATTLVLRLADYVCHKARYVGEQ